MKRITYEEAKGITAAGPFSFLDSCGSRATRLTVCSADIFTAAVCVDDWHGNLTVQIFLQPLQGCAR